MHVCKLPEIEQSQPNTAHSIASAQDDILTYFRVELHEILLYHGLVFMSQYLHYFTFITETCI